jgi:hypothetical protein
MYREKDIFSRSELLAGAENDERDKNRGVQFKLSRTSSKKIMLHSTARTGNKAIYAVYLPPRHCEPVWIASPCGCG